MPGRIITLTTDFGANSPYVAQMKGVILAINPNANLVDITHGIPPQDIRHAALVVMDTTSWFPRGTVHICVVDPGVGTDRRIVCTEIGGHFHVAPDNGLLSYRIQSQPPTQVVTVINRKYWLPTTSSTFHGRDIMAPVAAHLSLGVDAESLGPPADNLIQLEWPTAVVEGRRITGVVVAQDSFGNLLTNINDSMFSSGLEMVTVSCRGQEIVGISDAYGRRPLGSVIALFGSSGRLEIAVVNGNASSQLPIAIGDTVTVTVNGPMA